MLIPGIATNRDEIEVNPWSLVEFQCRMGSCWFVSCCVRVWFVSVCVGVMA